MTSATRGRRNPTPQVDTEVRMRTRAFARVLGPYVAIFTTILALRLPELPELLAGFFADPVIAWLVGAMMLAGGLVIIGVHRSWRGPAAVAVSLFGWFIALRGLALVITTTTVRSAVEATMVSSGALLTARVFFALLALVGAWLTYVGWFSGQE